MSVRRTTWVERSKASRDGVCELTGPMRVVAIWVAERAFDDLVIVEVSSCIVVEVHSAFLARAPQLIQPVVVRKNERCVVRGSGEFLVRYLVEVDLF